MLQLAHLDLHGVLCSGVPRDGEHTYALFADRVPAPRRLDRDEGLTEHALRYFTSHSPATGRDLAYLATLTVTDIRRGIGDAAGIRIAHWPPAVSIWFAITVTFAVALGASWIEWLHRQNRSPEPLRLFSEEFGESGTPI